MKKTVKQQIAGASALVVVLGTALIGALAALGMSMLATPQYEAHTRMYVSTTGGAPVNNASYQETTASQSIALSLVKLVQSAAVTERVVDSLQLDVSPSELAKMMETTVEPETVLIDLGVTSSSATLAREIANASAFEFADFVDELQLKTTSSAPKPKVTLVQPAATPIDPVSPNTPQNVGLGALAGIAVGLVLVNIRGRLIHTVRDSATLEAITGLPPLGAIPTSRVRADNAFDMVTRDAAMMESVREVRTNLVHLLESHSSRVVLVTSAGLNEGKTTTLCGIGAALSGAGHRVLVVDADLRTPDLTEKLQLANELGLSEVIDGSAELGDVIHTLRSPDVDVLPAGRVALHPSELLGSAAAEKLLQRLSETYEYVLVDTPPALAFTDTAVVATHSDGVV
ncbi:MAG: AAA family ATPase, partial [Desulfobacterales bacterium]|nr:AAA family ATPase [Desulfobacterales bacterium]